MRNLSSILEIYCFDENGDVILYELCLKRPQELRIKKMNPLPKPQHDDVKMKITYGGICGSDLRVLQGKVDYATYPIRPGHELIGTIIETGDKAHFSIGERVVVLPNTFCDSCDMCLKGKRNICRNKKSLGINWDGGFSQQFIISSKYLQPIPNDIPDEKAILIEPLAVVVHALKKVEITKDCHLAIIGCGNEGLLATALAHHIGVKVTVIDINPKKRELVKKIGQDITFLYPKDVTNEKFDIVIECAGVKSSVEQAINLINPGGSLVIIGLAQQANVPVVKIVRNEINIHGSVIYNFPKDYLDTIYLLQDPLFNVDNVISEIVPFKEFERAFESAQTGDFGKIILNFKEDAN